MKYDDYRDYDDDDDGFSGDVMAVALFGMMIIGFIFLIVFALKYILM